MAYYYFKLEADGSLWVWNLKSVIGEDRRDGHSGVWTIALSPDEKKVVRLV